MTNLFAFTDPCEPMCDMCTPLEMTPIYVQLKAEYEERECGTAWLDVLPDTTKFLESMRETTNRVNSVFANHALVMRQFNSSPIPVLEIFEYPPAVHDLSRTAGWSLEESADMYQRVAKWSADAITEADIKALGRSRMSKPNRYPTSTPPWARRKR